MFTMQLIAKQISTLENTLELANVKLGRTLLDNRKLIDEIGAIDYAIDRHAAPCQATCEKGWRA